MLELLIERPRKPGHEFHEREPRAQLFGRQPCGWCPLGVVVDGFAHDVMIATSLLRQVKSGTTCLESPGAVTPCHRSQKRIRRLSLDMTSGRSYVAADTK